MKRFKKFGTALLSCMMLTASFATVSNMTMMTAEAHPGRTDAQGCCNLIIYNLFNLLYLLWSHRREMSKVETQTVTGYQARLRETIGA